VSESGRTATVVLVSAGTVLGALPPLSLAMPWWPEAADLVAAVKERDGIDVTVLRLLRAPSDRQWGGDVAYLAETEVPPVVPLAPWPGDPLAEEPLRQPWARPGGPAALLGWAEGQLAEHGIRPTGAAEQMRSWNLSGIWRLPTSAGPVWLKVVPDFFAHEGAVMDWVGPGTAPLLHGWAPGRVLMAEVRGGANHEARGAALESMVWLLTDLQERAGRPDAPRRDPSRARRRDRRVRCARRARARGLPPRQRGGNRPPPPHPGLGGLVLGNPLVDAPPGHR
jgi:hypothetical protein